MEEKVSITPLGGVSDVTRNMYIYEYKNEILLVDCGIGFANETVIGVDLLLPDISYLKTSGKKIVGMAITHGHEDHMGALPYILPDLPNFPIYASPLTADFANEKLVEFGQPKRVQKVDFEGGEIKIGSFIISFIRVTHSIPDTSHIFIKTPIGNFYHGSDFKFDLTPYDGKKTDFQKIVKSANQGVLCLLSDALRAEEPGKAPSESTLTYAFEEELDKTQGKFIVTTFSSNISRLNQVISVAQKFNKRICFVGRSLIKAKDMAVRLGYMNLPKGMEVDVRGLKNVKDSNLVLIVAGSQGQENSALTRIVSGEFREIKLHAADTIVFSADPIPGNEISINSLIDEISKIGARALYHEVSGSFHVSGHGAADDLMLLMNLTRPKNVLPIGATYRQMVAYRHLARQQGFVDKNIILIENGQEVVFTKESSFLGKRLNLRTVFVDQISGEEVESFVIMDRQKIAKEGVVVVIAEVDSQTGQILDNPNIIARGYASSDAQTLSKGITKELKNALSKKKGPVTNWIYIRRQIADTSEKFIFRTFRKHPMVLPIVIEI